MRQGSAERYAIRSRIGVQATKGFIKFVRDGAPYGLGASRSRFGFLCVEGMVMPVDGEEMDPDTGEVLPISVPVLPSHYKSAQNGALLEVEKPLVLGLSGGRAVMILSEERFPQNCAQASLNQIGGTAETGSPSARTPARFPAATSFGRFPKLPLQDYAETTPIRGNQFGPAWRVSATRNRKIIKHVNGLISPFKLGGVNHPLRGWGRTPQAGSPTPTPRGFRARGPDLARTSRSDDGGPYRQAHDRRRLPPPQPTRKGDHHG